MSKRLDAFGSAKRLYDFLITMHVEIMLNSIVLYFCAILRMNY